MQALEWSSSASANSIEKHFRDIHRIIDDIKDSQDKFDTITRSVVRCSRELQSIERVHVNRWRFYGAEAVDDPFDIQDTLHKFSITCKSLNLINSPSGLDDDEDDAEPGCMPGMGGMLSSKPSRRVGKKKQIRALEIEFHEHERLLAIALSTAVYTTTLKIHRTRRFADSHTAIILRCAERRHAFLDRSDPASVKGVLSKNNQVRLEDTEWELNLRRYFDLVESWTGGQEEENNAGNGSEPTSRASSFTQAPWARPIKRQSINPPVSNETRGRSTHIDQRRRDEPDTNQYFRQPRRRSSSASSVGWVPANQASSRLSGSFSRSSVELVLYNPRHSASATAITKARPVRRASISNDFHWEYVGRSSTFDTLAPLTSRWPELKDAQVDIYTQTQGMSSGEARAYSLGRLAGLSPEITNEVRRVLSMKADPQGQESRITRASPSPTSQTFEAMESRRRSVSLDVPNRRPLPSNRPASGGILPGGRTIPIRKPESEMSLEPLNHGALVPRLTSKPKSANYERPPPESVRPMRKIVPSVQKRGFLGALSDLRPMTAISERSSRSGLSRTSLDKPSSRGIMQGFKSRRTNLSQLSILEPSILETVPDKAEGRSSSGSDTLTSNKDFEHGSIPRTPQSQKTITTSSTMNVQKPLPPRPRRNYGPKLFAAVFKTRKDKDHLQVPLASSLLSLQSPGSISQESLRRVSIDLLKRKENRMTIMSISDKQDVPFDIWLRALPYIEGRCSTPTPPRVV